MSRLSLMMFDIDYFKSVNNVYGNNIRDDILKEVAGYLTNYIRRNNVLGRYGGEEFLILLTETNKQGASIFAKGLLEAFSRYSFKVDQKGLINGGSK